MKEEPQESLLKPKKKEAEKSEEKAPTTNSRTPTKEKPTPRKFIWDSRTMMPDVIATRAKAIAIQAREEAAGRRISYSKIWIKEFLKLYPDCSYTSNNLSVHYWYWNSKENNSGGGGGGGGVSADKMSPEGTAFIAEGGVGLAEKKREVSAATNQRAAAVESVRRQLEKRMEGSRPEKEKAKRWNPQLNKVGSSFRKERKYVAFYLKILIRLEGWERRVKCKLKIKIQVCKGSAGTYFSPTRIPVRTGTFSAVFRIRIGVNALPDPAFCLYVDPDPGSQTNPDPYGSKFGSWSYFAVIKSWI